VIKRRHPTAFYGTNKTVTAFNGSLIAMPAQDHDLGIAGYGIWSCGSGQCDLGTAIHEVLIQRCHSWISGWSILRPA
jgi:hypothetical protein